VGSWRHAGRLNDGDVLADHIAPSTAYLHIAVTHARHHCDVMLVLHRGMVVVRTFVNVHLRIAL
jgi:hypothetical protein